MDRTLDLLSRYACALTYDALPPEVVHQVKRTLIDTLGCALGAFHAEPCRIARYLAEGVTGRMRSRVLGTRHLSAPDLAGFANGVMVRYLDCNDSYFSPGGGHPSDMIPAALALADPLGRDGRAVITAIVLAYEVFSRLSDQVVTGDLGWDQGMFSVLGAVCAAGKMLELDETQMRHAISLAIVPNLPLGVTRVGELPMWKGCATASATRAAIFAAQLAQQGMTGPAEPFEGRRGLWQQAVGKPVTLGALGGNGTPFGITATTFKSFPSQIHTQGPIQLALELGTKVSVAEIAALRISGYRTAVSSPATEPEKWDPRTRETADHSIPYVVAAALHDGAITPASFAPARVQDPALRPLIAKMSMEEDPDFTARFPQEYNCRIEVITTAGQRVEAHTAYPKGNRHNPLSDADVEAKFRRFAGAVLTTRQCDMVLERCWSAEHLANLQTLFDALVVEN
ncbi:MAG: MmgE/PrpD family protein [Candidatus Tectomicrobia bacterium]|uniref:MmgE/PrpD family protein n=1 Tax=Tectimicrobiota bacterium TaxID=2528274 RepID=A0A938B2E2_UNCTE|nr:MmgE/PrpD family protein [Candidatus Tectomicrobia bacterium]